MPTLLPSVAASNAKIISGVLSLTMICFSAIACSPNQARAQDPHDNRDLLLQAARGYGQGHQPLGAANAMAGHRVEAGSSQPLARTASLYSEVTEEQYESELRGSLASREFDKLENEANLARQGGRIPGGSWRLIVFYLGVGSLNSEDKLKDNAWKTRFNLLREWADAQPQSATPRVALAATYINYAAAARGDGYADTVSDDAQRLHLERAAMAASALIDAAHVKEKCPYWFETAQNVALDQGWDKSESRELFELAVAFEPSYYHYYREYANYLLPKWYGDEGETEAFAEEVFKRVGGEQGKFLYFEIASQLVCQCISERPPMPNLSWPRVKEGYAVVGRLYGYSNTKNNRMALMAYVAGDKQAAHEAFSRIGYDSGKYVWASYDTFERAKSWASNEQAQN